MYKDPTGHWGTCGYEDGGLDCDQFDNPGVVDNWKSLGQGGGGGARVSRTAPKTSTRKIPKLKAQKSSGAKRSALQKVKSFLKGKSAAKYKTNNGVSTSKNVDVQVEKCVKPDKVQNNYNPKEPLSSSNYPNPDPKMSEKPVRYQPKTIQEVKRMRQGKGPTTRKEVGNENIEAHHRRQVPIKDGGKFDELQEKVHRGNGNHTRHTEPSRLTPAQRAKEIREHYKQRGSEYILPGEGI